jgi:hypothetical protein
MTDDYVDMLQDDRWTKKSIDIRCQRPVCEKCRAAPSTTIHHGTYCRGLPPWEYPDETLWSLCQDCHDEMDIFRKQAVRLVGYVHPCDAELAIHALEVLKDQAAHRR